MKKYTVQDAASAVVSAFPDAKRLTKTLFLISKVLHDKTFNMMCSIEQDVARLSIHMGQMQRNEDTIRTILLANALNSEAIFGRFVLDTDGSFEYRNGIVWEDDPGRLPKEINLLFAVADVVSRDLEGGLQK